MNVSNFVSVIGVCVLIGIYFKNYTTKKSTSN